MITLFEKLSPLDQNLVENFNNIDLTTSLITNSYFTQLNARDLVMLADIFELNKYDISFASAMKSIMDKFNN